MKQSTNFLVITNDIELGLIFQSYRTFKSFLDAIDFIESLNNKNKRTQCSQLIEIPYYNLKDAKKLNK
jgi:hypothetical protein